MQQRDGGSHLTERRFPPRLSISARLPLALRRISLRGGAAKCQIGGNPCIAGAGYRIAGRSSFFALAHRTRLNDLHDLKRSWQQPQRQRLPSTTFHPGQCQRPWPVQREEPRRRQRPQQHQRRATPTSLMPTDPRNYPRTLPENPSRDPSTGAMI